MAKQDFKAMKKKISKSLDALANNEKKAESPKDDRFWMPVKDQAGNASAIIRFLPQQDPDNAPIIKTFRHGTEYKGRWFIEECPVTINGKCPICEYSSSIWNDDEQKARQFWRNKTYIANILIVKDEAQPELEGKVMLWKFGQQVYNMILKVVNNDEEQINIFDFDEGYNFKLELIQKSGYNNYDTKSSFAMKPTAIADGDEKKQEEIYNQIVDLEEFTAEDQFKSYEELKSKLDNFLGGTSKAAPAASKPELAEEDDNEGGVPFGNGSDDDDDFDFGDLDSDDDDIVL